MPSKILIGFGHKRQRGKDTSARYLMREMFARNILVEADAFAGPLKEVCATVFGFSHEQLNTAVEKEKVDPFWGFTPRWALQAVGTEAFRGTIDKEVWVKSLERRYQSNKGSRVITDVRFPNEAQMVRRLGGYLVRCNRDVQYDPKCDDHPTEVSLDSWEDWDFEIDNNGSKDYLEQQIIDMLNLILAKE